MMSTIDRPDGHSQKTNKPISPEMRANTSDGSQNGHPAESPRLPAENVPPMPTEAPILLTDAHPDGLDGTNQTSGELFDLLASLAASPEYSILLSIGERAIHGAVPAGQSVVLRFDLPEQFHDAQVLVFERDASGQVSLLSSHALMSGDIRFGRHVEIPRQRVSPQAGARPGELYLATPGTSSLLAVVVRSASVRLDRHPLFRASTAEAMGIGTAGRFDLPPVDPLHLRILFRQLAMLPSSEWQVVRATQPVLALAPSAGHHGTGAATDHASPTKAPFSIRSSQPRICPVANPAKASRTINPNTPSHPPSPISMKSGRLISAMPLPENFPHDLTLNADLLAAVRAYHRDATRQLAMNDARYSGHRDKFSGPEMTIQDGVFKSRWENIARSGLFLDRNGDRRPVSAQEIVLMQARIAALAHDLRYDGDWKHWDGIDALGLHPRSYFDEHLKGERKSLPKIELALIAHGYGLPLWVWEVRGKDVFEHFLAYEQKRRAGETSGKPLLAFEPFDCIAELAEETTALETFDNVEEAARAGMRSAIEEIRKSGGTPPEVSRETFRVGRARLPETPTLRSELRLWHRMILPQEFRDAEILLFERDLRPGKVNAVTLLNRARLVDGRLQSRQQVVGATPIGDPEERRVFETPTVPNSGIWFEPGESELVLLAANPGRGSAHGSQSLKHVRAFADTIRESDSDVGPMSADVVADLVRHVLSRDFGSWKAFKCKVAVC